MTTPAACARELTQRRHGPHDDRATADAAALAAETIRYLAYATSRDGLTTPATVYALTGDLSAAAARLPQVLAQITGWLCHQASAGLIADDHHRPARQVADEAAATLIVAARHAGDLARTLAAAQNLAATLHPADPG